MATTIQTIVDRARATLLETTASFWTDAELLTYALACNSDLWGMVIDLHQEHFLTIDETNVSLAANATSLTGVPSTCFRVVSIDVRDPETSSTTGAEFVPRDWNHPDAVNARRSVAIDPGGAMIPYSVVGQGPPVGTVTVRVHQKVTSAISLTLAYIPTHGTTALVDNNPIPGESDEAVKAWIIAHARAKERPDGSPDPAYMAIYAAEKANIRVRLTPRTEQELEVVEGLFDGM
jgi:hypothetical protein